MAGPTSSQPNWSYGYVPTAAEISAAFAQKQDLLNFTPLNVAGGTMNGKLQAAPSTINRAGFSILPGIAPTTPSEGDLWVTGGTLYSRLNGQVSPLALTTAPVFTGLAKFQTLAISGAGSTGDVSAMSVTPTGGSAQSLAFLLALASSASAAAGTATTGLMTPALTSNAVTAQTPNVSLSVGNITSAYLSKIAYGQVPVLDMFSPYRDGVNGDEPLLNAILNGHNACEIKPSVSGVGPVLAKNGPIIVPQNGKLKSTSGRQSATITRLSGYLGDTLQAGTSTVGMGSAEIEGLWFTAPGRFIPGGVPAGTTLPGMLTQGQAHIRAYGSQSGVIRNCGGLPIPYFIAQQGGYGLTIENSFTIGGLWDRTTTALQEAIAVLVTNYDPVHGHPTCTTVINPNWVGGNISAETRSIPLYSKSYSCQERIGPRYGWLHAAGEDCQMLSGFAGGFNRSPVAILPGGPALINGNPAWVQIKLSIRGARLDESMWAGIEALRSSASQAIHSGLKVHGCEFNGQLIGAHGLDFSPSSLVSVSQLDFLGNDFNAYQGAGARFYSISDGTVSRTRIRGYNTAGFDTTKGDPIDYGVGMLVGGVSNYLSVTDLRAGGGANNVTDPNNCQYGFADTTPTTTTSGVTTSNQNNSYRYVRAVNLGLAGGGPVLSGVNDTAS